MNEGCHNVKDRTRIPRLRRALALLRMLAACALLPDPWQAHAQGPFYTISKEPHRPKIEVLQEEGDGSRERAVQATAEAPVAHYLQPRDNGGEATVEEAGRCGAGEDSIAKIKEDLFAEYLSVSMPLKKIVVTSPFGMRPDPFERGKYSMHGGMDLRADGEPVYAMLFGRIKKVGKDKRSGLYVTIGHGDYTVSYCHLSEAAVSKGDRVSPGQPVGVTGDTGRSTGPHLHITAKYKGKAIDPALIIGFVRDTQEKAVAGLLAIGAE